MQSTQLTARLVGGLGNQLFIYSAGKYLACLSGRELLLDKTFLDTDRSKHWVSLANFTVNEKFVIQQNTPPKSSSRITIRLEKKLQTIIPFMYRKTYVAKGLGFEKTLKQKKCRNLVGYFQTWRYADYLTSIGALNLQLVSPGAKFLELARLAEEVRPTIIHIRRGDFTDSVNWYMGLLSETYYENGINFLTSEGITAEIWVFSDDPSAAESTLRFLGTRQVKWISDFVNELSAEEEMMLMTFGGAHIIANSTFSWWGAYLSKSSKCVVAPEQWFQFKEEPLDLIPPNWIRLRSYWTAQ